jgi:Domain of unknown function (DUF1902)
MATSDSPSDFFVTALWDADAGVFVSTSDIPGLVVEAETFDAFVELVHALAPEVIAANLPELKGPHHIRVQAQRDLTLAVA